MVNQGFDCCRIVDGCDAEDSICPPRLGVGRLRSSPHGGWEERMQDGAVAGRHGYHEACHEAGQWLEDAKGAPGPARREGSAHNPTSIHQFINSDGEQYIGFSPTLTAPRQCRFSLPYRCCLPHPIDQKNFRVELYKVGSPQRCCEFRIVIQSRFRGESE